MKIKAITNFAGPVSMYEGQIRVCEKTDTITALINDGYVEVLEEEKAEEEPEAGKKK